MIFLWNELQIIIYFPKYWRFICREWSERGLFGSHYLDLIIWISLFGLFGSHFLIGKFLWYFRLVNYPPIVTSVTDYYVVYGERLELPIEATDPEGMPITVSLLKGSPKDAVVQNNILLWNVTTKKIKTRFFCKVTDACKASATLNITITINVCQCRNNGQCVPQIPRGRNNYSCNCAPGFTGRTCDFEIDECESYPCSRGKLNYS